MSWETHRILYNEKHMAYSQNDSFRDMDFYDSIPIISIRNKKDARRYIDGLVDDSNIIRVAKRYFGLNDKKITQINTTNRQAGKPLIPRSNTRLYGGANDDFELVLDNTLAAKYIDGMMQILDTYHDFGQEAADEVRATGLLLPTIFLPEYKYYDKEYKKVIFIPKNGRESIIIELLANEEFLLFDDPNKPRLQKVENPLYKIHFIDYNLDNHKLDTMTIEQLKKNYYSFVGGVERYSKKYIPHELWSYIDFNTNLLGDSRKMYDLTIDMIVDICNDFRECYVPILGHHLKFQIDNWTVMGQVLIAFKYLDLAIYEKVTNSLTVIEVLESAYQFPDPITIDIEINDANGIDGEILTTDNFNIDITPTGSVYRFNPPYQLRLEGIRKPEEKDIGDIVSYVIDNNGLKHHDIYEDVIVKPEASMLTQYSIYEKPDDSPVNDLAEQEKYKVPFRYGMLSVDSADIFSVSMIKNWYNEYKRDKHKKTYIDYREEIKLELYRELLDNPDERDISCDYNLPYNAHKQEQLARTLKPVTQFAIKRARDWGQVESCIDRTTGKPNKIFVTKEKMAAAYAVTRGVPILLNFEKKKYLLKKTGNKRDEQITPFSFILSNYNAM